MRPKILLTILLTSTIACVVNAQQRDIYADPSNLTILPKDITPAELASVMRKYKLALGVECSHCHEGTDNRSYSDFDFASDIKETKRIAREMSHMVTAINGMVSGLDRASDHKQVEVTCVTCHRGNFRPEMVKDILVDTYAEEDNNIVAVIAKYIELREKYHGGFAFDFGEFPVSGFAFQLNTDGHPQDAIKLQKMNARFHPDSPNIPSGMGFIFRQAGQLELAAEAFRKSLEIDPDGRWAAKQLAELEELLD